MTAAWNDAFGLFAMHLTGQAAAPGADSPAAASLRQFLAACQQHVALMQALADEVAKGGQDAAQPLFERLSAWQRTVEAGRADPFAILRELGAFGMQGAVVPIASLQRIAPLQSRVLELHARMLAHAADIAREAMQRFAARAQQEPALRDPAALYGAWVECAEEAYAARASREDYCEAQAGLVNALNALRLEQRTQFEEWARVLDLPTRAEVNALIRRVGVLERARPSKPRARPRKRRT